jgi:hypothetical protein
VNQPHETLELRLTDEKIAAIRQRIPRDENGKSANNDEVRPVRIWKKPPVFQG